MDTSDQPAATIHPGAVRAIFDHLILSLTADGTPGDPVFLFSHYRFRWAADGIVGRPGVRRAGARRRTGADPS